MNVLLVFLKAPRPGAVKTRLVPLLGADGAAALYRALADAEIAGTAPRGGEYRRIFFFTPGDARAEMEAWLPGADLRPQQGEDLGARMEAAFAAAFAEGARRVAIVGTDVPWVSRATVREALDALEDHEVVIGPARDGGYYLLALTTLVPPLFRGLAWSTPSVLPATVERAGTLGLSVRLLDPRPDIDTPDDLRREWARLRPLLGDVALVARVERALGVSRA